MWDWFEQKLSESVPKPEAVPGYSRKKLLRRLFQILEKMEVLRPEWKQYRTQAEKTLMEAAPFSPEQEAAFQTLFTDIAAEQLMVYFLFTYFAGAVYDGDAWGKMKFSFAAMVLIRELFRAEWLQNPDAATAETLRRAAWRFARELEHSDPNKALLEKALKKGTPFFSEVPVHSAFLSGKSIAARLLPFITARPFSAPSASGHCGAHKEQKK